ncbi:MAG TPA: hypothetical protein VKF41_04240 [Bryobacteraceae bacterium]|nr:hypothetical protein [Bryobacteraceae bacterium]
MSAALSFVQASIWFFLQAVLITRLLRGNWRRFPLIFAFVIAEFLVAVSQIPTFWAASFHGTPATLSWSARVYERGEVFLEFFTFVVVISLIFRASAYLQSRRVMRVGCVAGAILFVGISFWVHYDPRIGVGLWMTPWTRDLNVGTTILDLALWSLLMAQRQKDDRLLLLSGALGIQFTGAAIGHSLRSLAPHFHAWPAMIGGKVVVVSSLIRVYLWARAFRSAPQVAGKGIALDVPSGPA